MVRPVTGRVATAPWLLLLPVGRAYAVSPVASGSRGCFRHAEGSRVQSCGPSCFAPQAARPIWWIRLPRRRPWVS